MCLNPPFNCVSVYRRVKPCLGSLASKKLHPVEPEEPFQPFEPVRESCEEPANAANSVSGSNNNSKSITSKIINAQSQNALSLASPVRSSALFSSLSPPGSVGTSGGDAGASEELNKSTGASEDIKGNCKTLGSSHGGTGAADVGNLFGLRGSPQLLGGFRGGVGGRPSPASRLSFVDRKWLERCQVYGEMVAEERPGAGNQEIDLTKKEEERAGGKEIEEEKHGDHRGGKGAMVEEGERRETLDLGRNEGLKSITSDSKVSKSAPKHAKGGEEVGEIREEENEMQRGLTPPLTPEDESPKSKVTKKRGRKRQREGENMAGEMTEEGGVKKRQRKGKKKKESSDVNPSAAEGGGGKKRRTKKKVEEEGEAEEEKETKVPKKVRQFIHIHLGAHCVL